MLSETPHFPLDAQIHSKFYDRARRGKTAKDIFVHGLVLDETTGKVVNLRVSFGPPGKVIPHVPFPAASAARNRRSSRPRGNIFRGKKFDFSKIM